jgi:hypothetical protein
MPTNRFLSLLLAVCVAVIIVLLIWGGPRSANAATSNYLLLCSWCTVSGEQGTYIVMLDTTTRELYAFRNYTAPPKHLGKMLLR